MISRSLFALVLLWPMGHMALSKTLDFSPWRFFGWGMYATPHPEQLVSLRVAFADGILDVNKRTRIAREFLHLQSARTARQLEKEVTSELKRDGQKVLILVTRQRASPLNRQLYTETRAFRDGEAVGFADSRTLKVDAWVRQLLEVR